jgi:hypothetical protein
VYLLEYGLDDVTIVACWKHSLVSNKEIFRTNKETNSLILRAREHLAISCLLYKIGLLLYSILHLGVRTPFILLEDVVAQ